MDLDEAQPLPSTIGTAATANSSAVECATGTTYPLNGCSEGSKGSGASRTRKVRNNFGNRVPGWAGFQEGSEFQATTGEHKAGTASWLPTGFRVLGDGSIEHEKSEEECCWLCSPLEVMAATRNTDGEAWGRLIRLRDRDHLWHEWPMPMSELAGSGDFYRARLLDMGLELAPGSAARNALHRLLTSANPTQRARCVTTLGWHGDVFMLPDGVVGQGTGERLVLQNAPPMTHNFRVSGSLDGWRSKIGAPAVGNSRLLYAISMAFAAPCCRVLGQEGGGVHFRGQSSTGKTTIAEAAGSVCGGGSAGYKMSWRATDNGVEVTAAVHNDNLLVLDEIGQVSPDAVGQVAYMLANGQAKQRMTRDGASRSKGSWCLLFLSTGEISLEDKMREGKRGARVMAGQQVRVLDLPADPGAGHGVFDTLHEFANGQALADHLKAAAASDYGYPMRAFLKRLVTEPWQKQVRASIDRFVLEVIPQGADGQVRRAAKRFALVAAAGELAREWEIAPWPHGVATESAARLFAEWLAARGGSAPAEIEAGVSAVRHFLELHGASRFVRWEDPGSPVHNRAGFSRQLDGGVSYYVTPEAWRNDILSGHDAGLISRALVERGMLKATAEGKPQTKQRLPDGTERKVYVVLPAIFDGSGA